jgi:hypothetical protein
MRAIAASKRNKKSTELTIDRVRQVEGDRRELNIQLIKVLASKDSE